MFVAPHRIEPMKRRVVAPDLLLALPAGLAKRIGALVLPATPPSTSVSIVMTLELL